MLRADIEVFSGDRTRFNVWRNLTKSYLMESGVWEVVAEHGTTIPQEPDVPAYTDPAVFTSKANAADRASLRSEYTAKRSNYEKEFQRVSTLMSKAFGIILRLCATHYEQFFVGCNSNPRTAWELLITKFGMQTL